MLYIILFYHNIHMSINETNPHQDDENNKFYLETLTDEELSAKSHKYIPGDPTPILLHLLKYPEEATNEFLIKYPKIWKRWARKETFDSFEQTKITKELTAIADFWKTQIVDRSDPQDDGLVNYAWAKNILLSRQKSIDQ